MRAMREALAGLTRFPGRTAASTLAIAMALILCSVFVLVTVYSHGILSLLRKGEEISVYVRDELQDAAVLELDAVISRIPGVESTRIMSKEDAAAEFEEMFGKNLLSTLEDNPLPRSIVVTLSPEFRNSAGFESLGRRIEIMTGVESVEYGREWLAKMDLVFFVIMVLEIVLGALVGIAGLIIIANTVGMNVIIRGESIEVMRLVGATEGYIRRPFYLEGAIQGGLAGIIAYCAVAGPWLWAEYHFPDFELYLHTFGVSKEMIGAAGKYLAALIPCGASLGFLGSHFAIRRAV